MKRLAVATLMALPLAAGAAQAAPRDPLEAINRQVHGFNVLAQRHVLGPVAVAYVAWTPAPVRAGVANAVANLGEPVTVASALLAGEPRAAATAAMRFGINTTLGLGGVRDAAAEMGYRPAPMGIGDVLCRWGIPSGPYLVLPLLGPSTLRDAGGMVATSLTLAQALGSDAVLAWTASASFLDYTGVHPVLERIEQGALDGYATLRSIHRQRRAADCHADTSGEDDDED